MAFDRMLARCRRLNCFKHGLPAREGRLPRKGGRMKSIRFPLGGLFPWM
jgi:hypothetical protein